MCKNSKQERVTACVQQGGFGVYFSSEAATHKLLPHRIHSALTLVLILVFEFRIYFSAAGQSFGHAGTSWYSNTYYRHEQRDDEICVCTTLSIKIYGNDKIYGIALVKTPCISYLGEFLARELA